MADYKYVYGIDQFPNHKYDLSKLDKQIRDSSITVSLSYLTGKEIEVDMYFRGQLDGKDWATLSGVVAAHDGVSDNLTYDPVKIVATDPSVQQNVILPDELRDPSGKLRVQQTSRKIGLRIMWTGIGDDASDITKVGNGETFTFDHEIGDTEPMVKYIDFNIIENETWMHEGYMTWSDADMDTLTLQVVPRVATVSGVVGGDKTVYGGYLVIPTASGAGNYEVTSDLGDPNGGLFYIPGGDLDKSPNGFWDADWNTTTKRFENVRPNYTQTGRYNIFCYEVVLLNIINQIPLLGSGFICLSSSDTEQMGQGMRIKMIADTNNNVPDHRWCVACILCNHRYRSV
jgi:hypothetical protein